MACEIDPIYTHPIFELAGEYVPEFDLTYYDDIPAPDIRKIEESRVKNWWESVKGEVTIEHVEVTTRFDLLKATVQEYMSASEVAEVENAFLYAYFCHNFRATDPENRFRKDKQNHYMVHPVEVAQIWADRKLRKETVISSLLHDIREDTFATPEEIYSLFGQVVGQNVEDATKIRKSSRDETNELQIYKLLLSVKDVNEGGNPEALLVKIADKLDNMRTLGGIPSKERRKEIAQDTYKFYVHLAERLGLYDIASELRYLSIKYIYTRKRAESARKKMEAFNDRISTHSFLTMLKGMQQQFGSQLPVLHEPARIHEFMAPSNQETVKSPESITVLLPYNSQSERDAWRSFISNSFIDKKEATRITQGHWKYEGLPFGDMLWNIELLSGHNYELRRLPLSARYRYNEKNPEQQRKLLNEKLSNTRELITRYETEHDVQILIEQAGENLPYEQIVVFTPRGEKRLINDGSTGADFAYEIKRELLPYAIGIRVNGQKEILPLTTVVKPEQMVEVVKSTSWEHMDPGLLDPDKLTNPSARNYYKQLLLLVINRDKDENVFYDVRDYFNAGTAVELDTKAKPIETKLRIRAINTLQTVYRSHFHEKLNAVDRFSHKEEYDFFEVWDYASQLFRDTFRSWHRFLYELELTDISQNNIGEFLKACEKYENRQYDSHALTVENKKGVIADFSSGLEKLGADIIQFNRRVNDESTPENAATIRLLVDPKDIPKEVIEKFIKSTAQKYKPI